MIVIKIMSNRKNEGKKINIKYTYCYISFKFRKNMKDVYLFGKNPSFLGICKNLLIGNAELSQDCLKKKIRLSKKSFEQKNYNKKSVYRDVEN